MSIKTRFNFVFLILLLQMALPTFSCEIEVAQGIVVMGEVYRRSINGEVGNHTEDVRLVRETSVIPYITKGIDPDFMFGYVVNNKGKEPCQHQATLYLPQGEGRCREVGCNGIALPERILYESDFVGIRLEDTDSPGNYRFDIVMDGKLVKTVNFEVTEKVPQGN